MKFDRFTFTFLVSFSFALVCKIFCSEDIQLKIVINNFGYEAITVAPELLWGKWYKGDKSNSIDVDPFVLLPGDGKELNACGRFFTITGIEGILRITLDKLEGPSLIGYFTSTFQGQQSVIWEFKYPLEVSVGGNGWGSERDQKGDFLKIDVFREDSSRLYNIVATKNQSKYE